MSFKVIRTHEICAGHRVVGHESKCRHLHGHNYVFHFKVQPKSASHDPAGINQKLDGLGRVIDFSVIKSTLCEWLENNWDHKFLHWEKDTLIQGLKDFAGEDEKEDYLDADDNDAFTSSLVSLPFNPTAENLAAHMVNVVGPQLLDQYGVELVTCAIEETSKCHVEYTI